MIGGLCVRVRILRGILLFSCFLLAFSSSGWAATESTPFSVLEGLLDQSKPMDLGLTMAEGTETITVFSPTETSDQYSHGVVMIGFKDHLYCQWQSSATDEDSSDTWVAYSRSADGITWTKPMVLAPTLEDGYRSSGGWWKTDDVLISYINVWPSDVSPRGGYTEYTTSTDGISWSSLKRVTMADGSPLLGIFEQDPKVLPTGRIINSAHFQPGLLATPIYTDDPLGISDWKRGDFENLPYSGSITRELEPSWFQRSDGAIVMVFRDQNSSYRILASVSLDNGESWSTPVLTNMPDSRAKQSAGNLPDGRAFLVGNPVPNKTRIPLVITLSEDGQVFDQAFLLRAGGSDLQPQRYQGLYKRAAYSYPKSTIWQDYLYVSYATNKEDVEFTRIPLTSLSR